VRVLICNRVVNKSAVKMASHVMVVVGQLTTKHGLFVWVAEGNQTMEI
jgi:hypothetical protein